MRAELIALRDGRPDGVVSGRSPMTGQSLATELAEARRRLAELESLVENSPVAVIVMDSDERVTDWNPAAAALFGYSAEEALGRPIDDLVLGDAGRERGARGHARGDRDRSRAADHAAAGGRTGRRSTSS